MDVGSNFKSPQAYITLNKHEATRRKFSDNSSKMISKPSLMYGLHGIHMTCVRVAKNGKAIISLMLQQELQAVCSNPPLNL